MSRRRSVRIKRADALVGEVIDEVDESRVASVFRKRFDLLIDRVVKVKREVQSFFGFFISELRTIEQKR